MKLPRALSALNQRDFLIYWIGQAISLTGTWMQQGAQVWVLSKLSDKARDLGISTLIGSLPILLLSFKAGELADRVDKRRILIVTQLALMVLAFAFAALVYTHRINLVWIFVMSGLLGIVTAFDLPAAQALPPELVAPGEIGGAVALMQQIFHGSRLIGPAIGFSLMAHYGDASAFVANGVSFIAVIASLLAIQPHDKRVGAAKKRAQGGIGEGLRYVRGDAVIGPLMLLAALITALVFPFIAVMMAYYVHYVIGTEDARVMGHIMSASGFGSFLGATVILWGSARSRRYWFVFGVIGVALALMSLGLFPVAMVATGVAAGLSFSVSSLMGRVAQTIQERAPPELRGRVMGVFSIAFSGVMPFAALGISALSDRIGYTHALEGSAALFGVVGLLLVAVAWRPLTAAAEAIPVSVRPPPGVPH